MIYDPFQNLLQIMKLIYLIKVKDKSIKLNERKKNIEKNLNKDTILYFIKENLPNMFNII